ncbi:hypothetical protein [Frigoribacterium salinisoli]
MNTRTPLSARQLQHLSHEQLVGHLRSTLGDATGLSRREVSSFYVRDERVPVVRIGAYPKRRPTGRLVVRPVEPTYEDFLREPAAYAVSA